MNLPQFKITCILHFIQKLIRLMLNQSRVGFASGEDYSGAE